MNAREKLNAQVGLSVSQSVEADTIGDAIRMYTKEAAKHLDDLRHWQIRLEALLDELGAPKE
ncbi:hypothetical protein [Roseobacter phage RDJL6]|nr:hypothetical protein [Roseobacter phage RDJL6]